jgi:hypothetical protein
MNKVYKLKCDAPSAERFRIYIALLPCWLFNDCFSIEMRRSSSVCIAICWTAGIRFPTEEERFLFSTVSCRPALGSTYSPVGARDSSRG